MTKVYELPDGHRFVADIGEDVRTCNITETQLDGLIRDLNYYADKCKEYEKQEQTEEMSLGDAWFWIKDYMRIMPQYEKAFEVALKSMEYIKDNTL